MCIFIILLTYAYKRDFIIITNGLDIEFHQVSDLPVNMNRLMRD